MHICCLGLKAAFHVQVEWRAKGHDSLPNPNNKKQQEEWSIKIFQANLHNLTGLAKAGGSKGKVVLKFPVAPSGR